VREAFKDVADDTIVIMSKDGEGNSFSPLDTIEHEGWVYQADNTWSGEVIDTNSDDYDEDDLEGTVPAVVLWPVN
jgi:hypothetical protein